MIFKREIKIPKPDFWKKQNQPHWHLKKLNQITVLFGKNGSGKSILLRKWRDLDTNKFHYIVPERTGDMGFDANLMAQQITVSGRTQHSQKNYSPHYRKEIVSRIQGYFIKRGAHKSDSPPGNNPSELESLIGILLPDFTIELLADNPPYSLKRIENGQVVTNVDQLSSGESALFTLGLDILMIAAMWELENNSEKILLLDEPDLHIHQDLQVRLADFIFHISNRFNTQIVLATHSTTLLAALGQFGITKTSVIYMNNYQNELNAKQFDSYLKSISAFLGGHLLMGPLFGAPILMVEGDDDYRVWSQVPRHGVINIAVIPCNGDDIKHYQKKLEEIFASLCESSVRGFVLLDSDKNLPDPKNTQIPQNHIKFIRLSCHECENLYIANEVLNNMGLDWNKARQLLKKHANKYGNKEKFLLNLAEIKTDEERKQFDLKKIINEISLILDSKNIHWTIRVGQVLGRCKPTGQIADFLGKDVIEALWEI